MEITSDNVTLIDIIDYLKEMRWAREKDLERSSKNMDEEEKEEIKKDLEKYSQVLNFLLDEGESIIEWTSDVFMENRAERRKIIEN